MSTQESPFADHDETPTTGSTTSVIRQRAKAASGETGEEASAATRPMLEAIATDDAEEICADGSVNRRRLAKRFANGDGEDQDRWQVLRRIGAGAYSSVYEVEDRRLNRSAAMKEVDLRDAAAADIEQLVAEAEILAHLQHPNIVSLFDVTYNDGCLRTFMEMVDGVPLDEWLAGAPRNDRDIACIIQRSAAALAFAHHRGIIHRDIKPANILVDRHLQPHILDFGLARRTGRYSGSRLHQKTIRGTPSYLPPEAIEQGSDTAGPASDIYSLGATLYFLLTGQPPFRADSVPQLLQAIVSDSPPAPRLRRPGIPSGLEAICLRCLQKNPGTRYANAQLLADDLDNFLNARPVTAEAMTRITRLVRRWRRHRLSPLHVVAIVSCALLGGLLLGHLLEFRDARHEPTVTIETDRWQTVAHWTPSLGPPPANMHQRPGDLGRQPVDPTDRANWLWLDHDRLQDGVRLVGRWQMPTPDALEVILHCQDQELPTKWHVPSGHACKLIVEDRLALSLARLEQATRSKDLPRYTMNRSVQQAFDLEVVFAEERLRVLLDGQEIGHLVDPLPLPGTLRHTGIALRWFQPTTRMEFLRLERPQWNGNDPLAAGRALQRVGHHDLALQEFNNLLSDRPDDPAVPRAFCQGVISAELAGDRPTADRLALRFAQRFPDHPTHLLLLEYQAQQAWRAGDHDRAIALLEEVIVEHRTPSLTPHHWLNDADHRLSGAIVERLVTLLRHHRQVLDLDLADLAITDFDVLRDLRLVHLDLSGTPIRDLSVLRDMPLERLRLSNSSVADLSPLAGMPLERLRIDNTAVTDLRPLAGCRKLNKLSATNCPIEDLQALQNLPLQSLSLGHAPIAEWRPLAHLPLRKLTVVNSDLDELHQIVQPALAELTLQACPISSLAGIDACQLDHLDLAYSPVTAIDELAGQRQLRSLSLRGCPVDDLEPLRHAALVDCRIAYTRVRHIDAIVHDSLRRLDLSGLRIDDWHSLRSRLTGLQELTINDSQCDDDFLQFVAAGWDGLDPDCVRDAQALLAHRAGDAARLRDLARTANGQRYLCLPITGSRAQAEQIAARYGARLPQRCDVDVFHLLMGGRTALDSCWIAAPIETSDGHYRWDDGSAVDLILHPNNPGSHHWVLASNAEIYQTHADTTRTNRIALMWPATP